MNTGICVVCLYHAENLNFNQGAVKTSITHNTFGYFRKLSCFCRQCFSKHLHPSFKLSFAVCSNIRCVLVSCCGMEILGHSRTNIFIRERKKVRSGFLTMIFSILTTNFLFEFQYNAHTSVSTCCYGSHIGVANQTCGQKG